MLLEGTAIIKKCVEKTKVATKEGQQDFKYYILSLVGMGFGVDLFSLVQVEPTKKEVLITCELSSRGLGYVGHEEIKNK